MDKVLRGHAATALLENELLKEVLNELDGTYHARWRVAQTVEAREDLFRHVKALEQLITDIKTIARTGALESQRLEQLAGNVVRPPLNDWAQERRG